MSDKPPTMVPAEQAHLLDVDGGGRYWSEPEPGDHSALDVRCVAERILSKLLVQEAIRQAPSPGWIEGIDSYTIPLDPAELALIQRLIAEDAE